MKAYQIWPFFLQTVLGFSTVALLTNGHGDLYKDVRSSGEICDNGLDDDGDGLTDINDADCICEIVKPKSLIPNPSFEEKNCCPQNRSQLNCANSWIQASEATTDYIHKCGWLGWPEFPAPVPFPDGDGIVGLRDGRVGQGGSRDVNWKEYAGACLLSPLLANTTYLFEFHIGFVNDTRSPPINITFFGGTDCVNLPFGVGNAQLGCPTNGPGWVRLGSRYVSGNNENKWVKTNIEVTPSVNIHAIAIGPDCPGVSSSVSIYYFFDNLVLADLESFQFKIEEVTHPCSDKFLLEIPEKQNITYQWYKNGIALIDEKSFRISGMYGEGLYQVRVLDGASCKLSGVYDYKIPVIDSVVNKIICNDDIYRFGDKILSASGNYSYTFKTKNNCDSTVHLNLKILDVLQDTVYASIFEGESFRFANERFTAEGNYDVHLQSLIGCDSIVHLELGYYKVYFPNIFSPNDDGSNDVFSVFSEDGLIVNREISIFDRWGALISRGEKWDGKNKGIYVSPGVFTYVARLLMNDGIERLFKGSVTVVR